MARQALLRFLETAFRRWWIIAITVGAMAALAVVSLSDRTEAFHSDAVLRAANETILGDPTQDSGNQFAFDSPAEITSAQINEAMRTDEFVDSVLERAGIRLGVLPGLLQRSDVRTAVHAFANGDNLLRVQAATTNPEASQRLVQATIDTFVTSVIDATITESTAAQEYYSDLLIHYEDELEQADTALNTYLGDHPEPLDGERPTSETLEIERLSTAVARAEDNYSETQSRIEEAELAISRTRADVNQRLRVVDAPALAAGPVSTRRDDILSIVLYATLGVVLAMLAIGVLTVLDRSLHTADEIRSRLGVEVLTTVPEARRRQVAVTADGSGSVAS